MAEINESLTLDLRLLNDPGMAPVISRERNNCRFVSRP